MGRCRIRAQKGNAEVSVAEDAAAGDDPSLPLPVLSLLRCADLSYSNFVKVLTNVVEPNMKSPEEHKELMLEAFRTFEDICRDSEEGKISKKDLSVLMTRHGDPIDVASFKQLLSFTNNGDGLHGGSSSKLDYGKLVDSIVSASKATSM